MSNREILFAAKAADNTWYYGTPLLKKSTLWGFAVSDPQYNPLTPPYIDLDTLCQYIGLLVKQEEENGQVSFQKAFEHDIVFNEDWTPTTYEIVFEGGEFLLRNETAYAPIEYLKDFVRIGNSIDNPELLNP